MERISKPRDLSTADWFDDDYGNDQKNGNDLLGGDSNLRISHQVVIGGRGGDCDNDTIPEAGQHEEDSTSQFLFEENGRGEVNGSLRVMDQMSIDKGSS